jgi:hypothetical protein
MPVGSSAILKWDSSSLLSSLTGYLFGGFIFKKGYRRKLLSKFSQAAKKQP